MSGKNLGLDREELKTIQAALLGALSHHVEDKLLHKVVGTFTIEKSGDDPDDFNISIDADIRLSSTVNDQLSGKFDWGFLKCQIKTKLT